MPLTSIDIVVLSFSTVITEAAYERLLLPVPAIHAEVVSCAAAHETRRAVEKILDIMLI